MDFFCLSLLRNNAASATWPLFGASESTTLMPIWAAHLRVPSKSSGIRGRTEASLRSHSKFVLGGNCHFHASALSRTKGLPFIWRVPRNTDGKGWKLPAKSGNHWAIRNVEKLTVKELGERFGLKNVVQK